MRGHNVADLGIDRRLHRVSDAGFVKNSRYHVADGRLAFGASDPDYFDLVGGITMAGNSKLSLQFMELILS
jgi:hypothetical protein